MPADFEQVRDYFAPPQASFWSWQDEGQVLVWSDGATIAFAREIQYVMRRLATQGLPPFGAVVLLLAACRDNWRDEPRRANLLAELVTRLSGTSISDFVPQVISFLDAVNDLPRECRTTIGAKAEIASTVFERADSPRQLLDSDELCEAFENGLTAEQCGIGFQPVTNELNWQAGGLPHAASSLTILLGELACLRDGLSRIDPESLSLRLKTGLDQDVAEAPIELDPAGAIRSLMVQLQDDEELGGLARLARLLMAAVQMPRALSDPEELPVGGISDISNRGTLDRLLLSELASDDLTLAVRVAMNEALYLRRESPPRTPPEHRTVLLDAGIRMWGVPRVFATAVGLALAATADRKVNVATFRANGKELAPVDLTTLDGLRTHLAALDHRAHPGESLAAFAAQWQKWHCLTDAETAAIPRDDLNRRPSSSGTCKAEEIPDLVLVTSEEVLSDRGFQQVLEQLALPGLHIATVARDGRFRLICRTPRGGKLLREARLDLEAVLQPTKKPVVPLLGEETVRPAIFDVQPFPLLLSCPLEVDRAWHVDDYGVLMVTRDGRLLLWNNPALGGRQLAEGLPAGSVQWCTRTRHYGAARAVVGNPHGRGLHVLSVNTSNDSVGILPLHLDVMNTFCAFCRDGVVFVLGYNGSERWVNVADQQSGKLLISRRLPIMGKFEWRMGRFFTLADPNDGKLDWFALSYDGSDIRTTLVYKDREPLLAMFDVHGVEGPVGVIKSGGIRFTGNQRTQTMKRLPWINTKPFSFAGVSRDGLCFVVIHESTQETTQLTYLVQTLTGVAREHQLSRDYGHLLEPVLGQFVRPRTLRHRFHAITIGRHCRLTLIGRRGHHWPIELDEEGTKIMLAVMPAPADECGEIVDFVPLARQSKHDYTLAVARWSDGSRAWIDSRGLLHLRSADLSVPQCTIVLAERETAGWCSDGRCWGPQYYHIKKPVNTARLIYDLAIRAFVDRLP